MMTYDRKDGIIMTTLYDIGDEIKITLVGKVIGYSMSREGGDNYSIEIIDNRKTITGYALVLRN